MDHQEGRWRPLNNVLTFMVGLFFILLICILSSLHKLTNVNPHALATHTTSMKAQIPAYDVISLDFYCHWGNNIMCECFRSRIVNSDYARSCERLDNGAWRSALGRASLR